MSDTQDNDSSERKSWPRLLASGGVPDPFGQHWWTLMQVLAWVYLRDPAVVRLVAPPEPFETTFTIKDLRVLGRNGAYYSHFADAEDAVIEALQAERLTATGVANNEGDRKEIPSRLWLDLEFRDDPISARLKDFSRTAVTNWRALRFQRKDVLAVWPDAPESLAMADERETSTTADGNANFEPPESTLPSCVASRSGANLAATRWIEAGQKRKIVLDKAESVARERWKNYNDDHARMTSWLQGEYSTDNGALPFVDDKLTRHLLERMANVARELGKPVKGEKRSPG